MWKHKPTRTEDNKAPKSWAIRKWSMKQEEITKVAQELTKCPEIIEEVQAPAIEPVVHWDYEIIAAYIKAHCATHETFTATSEDLLKMIPQNKRATSIASNFNKIHWLSYRKTEWEDNNDTYVFFVEPTREELIVMLTSAENNTIEWEQKYTEQINKDLKEINSLNSNMKDQKETIKELIKENTNWSNMYRADTHSQQEYIDCINDDLYNLWEENEQLKKRIRNTSFWIDFIAWLSILCLLVWIAANYYWK